MNSPEELNRRFGLNRQLVFDTGPGGLTVARIANDHASATIALQGAHVLAWQPRGEEPVIWLSPAAKFASGTSVRGGVPVCWPWFSAHVTESAFPAHGFARTVPWSVAATERRPDGSTRIAFRLEPNDATRAQWPHATPVETVVTVAKVLEVVLITRNAGTSAVTIGEALHTYFTISDIRQVSVTGLDGRAYLDKVKNFAREQQAGPLRFTSETDRIYLDTGRMRDRRPRPAPPYPDFGDRQPLNRCVEPVGREGGKNGRLRQGRLDAHALRRDRERRRGRHYDCARQRAPPFGHLLRRETVGAASAAIRRPWKRFAAKVTPTAAPAATCLRFLAES